MNTSICSTTQTSPKAGRRGLRENALLRTRAYMEMHIGEAITLDMLAGIACVSRFHFARLFRISTGESPMAYLLSLRVERAKQLLRREGVRVVEVAAALGFFDQSHFARSFRRVTGYSPRQYMASVRPAKVTPRGLQAWSGSLALACPQQ